jgi:hypothetical protein
MLSALLSVVAIVAAAVVVLVIVQALWFRRRLSVEARSLGPAPGTAPPEAERSEDRDRFHAA